MSPESIVEMFSKTVLKGRARFRLKKTHRYADQSERITCHGIFSSLQWILLILLLIGRSMAIQ